MKSNLKCVYKNIRLDSKSYNIRRVKIGGSLTTAMHLHCFFLKRKKKNRQNNNLTIRIMDLENFD